MTVPCVLFGGPSPEHDVSVLTGLQACRVLIEAGYEPLALFWSKSGEFHLVDAGLEASVFVGGVPPQARRVTLEVGSNASLTETLSLGRRRQVKVSVVVNCCHGGAGEDGRLQGALDIVGLPYTGPTARGAALGMDKLAFGAVVARGGLPTLRRTVLSEQSAGPEFAAPWLLKPRFGGSSLGIAIVHDIATARALLKSSPYLRDGATLEPYLDNAVDLNVGVRSFGEVRITEVERPIRQADGQVYSYSEKYLGGEGLVGAPRELPALLPDAVTGRLRAYSAAVTDLAQVRGAGRLDFLLHNGEVWVNEINTIPGALGFYLWRASGVSHRQLLEDMITEALERPTHNPVLSGADGAALRSAGAIASKLA